jgi:hypothetical protein
MRQNTAAKLQPAGRVRLLCLGLRRQQCTGQQCD